MRLAPGQQAIMAQAYLDEMRNSLQWDLWNNGYLIDGG
jgi:hypothetical protein